MSNPRRGYVMAMLSSAALIAAATFGVSVASEPPTETVAATTAVSTTAASTSTVSTGSVPSDSGPAPTATESVTASGATSTVAPTAGSDTGTTPTPAPTGATTAAESTTTTAAPVQAFKDGQYQATAQYPSPGGTETLGVTLTVAGDKVTASELELLGGAGISQTYQKLFQSGYLDQVVGQDLATIMVGAVAGSSLTGIGFNDAVDQIEEQARA